MLLLVGARAVLPRRRAAVEVRRGRGWPRLGAVPVAWTLPARLPEASASSPSSIPERDPLGAGYHILQSKIALGSGGLFGKGFLQGTQSQLNFLPEKQTDFIFTMLAEEFGMVGGAACCSALYRADPRLRLSPSRCAAATSSAGCWRSASPSTCSSTSSSTSAMVMGLLPVVGVPLPLVSYGGTAMLTVLIGFGLVHVGLRPPRHADRPAQLRRALSRAESSRYRRRDGRAAGAPALSTNPTPLLYGAPSRRAGR